MCTPGSASPVWSVTPVFSWSPTGRTESHPNLPAGVGVKKCAMESRANVRKGYGT
jgi:hypothetical protein